MPREQLIQFRQGTAAQWASANPVLASGEMGYETDTKKAKMGDGSTTWASLAYWNSGGASGGGGPNGNVIIDGGSAVDDSTSVIDGGSA